MLLCTKIIATLGPACWDEDTLRQLFDAGVSVIRLNFSHADLDITAQKIALIRRLSDEGNRNIAILADLQGPRIRVGKLPPGGIPLTTGAQMTICAEPEDGPAALMPYTIPVDYAGLAQDVRPGDSILLDDGLLVLRVTDTNPAAATLGVRVVVGGTLTSHKGINVPARPLRVPTLTEKDRADLAFALDQGVDLIALSFVRSGADVVEARHLIAAQTERAVGIIAKIEKYAAVANFETIFAAADGVMVARGDLGVELPPEVLPGIQKRLIAAANQVGKPVITATQMLDSMIRNPRPTRAEATDVANAVLDGTDAIMLSGETATGAYPLAAVQIMARIALEAEHLFDYEGWAARMAALGGQAFRPELGPVRGEPEGPPDNRTVAEVLCEAADRIGEDLGARAIVTMTQSGTSARLVAKYRPRSALIAVTDRLSTQRVLALTWGVQALRLDSFSDTLATLDAAERLVLDAGLVAPGDLMIFTGGLPHPVPGSTTLLKVHIAGSLT